MQQTPENENYICYPCSNYLYSDGFSGCRDCDYWQVGAPLSFFRTSLINDECFLPPLELEEALNGIEEAANGSSEEEVETPVVEVTPRNDNPRSEKVSTEDDAGGSSSKGWVAPVVVLLSLVVAIIAATIVVVKGLCCDAFYNRFSKLQKYKKSPRPVVQIQKQGSE